MKSILEELWYGNICPETDKRTNSPEMKQLMGTMAKYHDELMSTLTDEQKEIFEKFDDCWGEYVSLTEKSVFVYAFKLGARIVYEILTVNDQQRWFILLINASALFYFFYSLNYIE